MYAVEFDDFKQTLSDLCVSVNRPFTDELTRVFWEDLRHVPLGDVRSQSHKLRTTGKTRFVAADLKPERPAPAVSTFEPLPNEFDHFHCFGQLQFLKFLRLHEVSNDQLPKLIQRKNEIIDAARHDPDMQEGDAVEMGTQLHEILFSAWRKAVTS
jgi:hypothetical protein